jgi:hypothetical protein
MLVTSGELAARALDLAVGDESWWSCRVLISRPRT